jgi:hypothetical protein
MTAAEIGALIEADMAAAVLTANGEGISTSQANAATLKTRIKTAYDNALIAIFTPWLGGGVSAGFLSFTKSEDHASVTNYTAQLRLSGSATVVDTLSLGVPTPNTYGVIVADLTALFSGKSAGDYTVSIVTTTPSGATDSGVSDAFTLPLA